MARMTAKKSRTSRPISPLIAVIVLAVVVGVVAYFFVRSGRREIKLPTDVKVYEQLAPSDEMIAAMKRENPNLKLPPLMEEAVRRRHERERQGIKTPLSIHEGRPTNSPSSR